MNATSPSRATGRRWLAPATLSVVALAMAGCGSSSIYRDDQTASKGRYKPYRPYVVGVPYTIKGIRYEPKENLNYRETGIASWYGPGFHGKRTANGEEYNQNAMTAAHRTLPMPSIVKVTNLENGRSIVVRINDRGPFADDRIIDLSREGARRLKMIRHGTARVRVRLLRRETIALKRSGQTYANMAALNRRYVDGKGSGTVIASRPPQNRPKDPPKKPAANVIPLPKPRAEDPPLYAADRRSKDSSDDRSAGTRASGSISEKKLDGDTDARRPLKITPANNRASDRKSWRDDVPPADDDRRGRNRSDDRSNDRADNRTSARERRSTARPLATRRRVVRSPAPAAGRIYVQAAAYTEKSKARRVRRKLGNLAKSRVTAVQIRRTVFYRVRLGPVSTAAQGDRLLARVVAMGYRNARVVIDPARP